MSASSRSSISSGLRCSASSGGIMTAMPPARWIAVMYLMESRAARCSQMPQRAWVSAVQIPMTGRGSLIASRLATPAQQGAPDLAARRLGQLGRELNDTRVLVGRRLSLDVILQLAGELVRRLRPVAQHDDRAHDCTA